MISCRASATFAQTFVPISTNDWRNSGFSSSPNTGLAEAMSVSMWAFRSPLSSTIWNSSSMPMVSHTLTGALHHVCWHDASRSGRDVQQGRRGKAGQAAAGPPLEEVGVEVERELEDLGRIAQGDRERLPGYRHRLLHHVRPSDGRLERVLPFDLVD